MPTNTSLSRHVLVAIHIRWESDGVERLVIVPEQVAVLTAVFDHEEMLLPIVVHCPDVVAVFVTGNVHPCMLFEPVVIAVQTWCVIECLSREEIGHFL